MSSVKTFLTLLLAAFTSAPLSHAKDADAAPASLRVMSFNIRYDNPKDGPDAWPKRKDFVISTIKAFNPDLLGLQEVREHQGAFLKSQLDDYHFIGVGRDDGKSGGEFCPVMFRKDAFEILDQGHFWLSTTPEKPGSKSWDSSLPRLVTWVKLKPRHEATPFLFANTHFDHRGPQARLESAKLIHTRLPALAGPDTPIILTGDFNTLDSAAPYAELVADKPGFFIDTYRSTHPALKPSETTFTGFKAPAPGRRIDWILHSPHFETVEASINKTISKENRYPSDHFPVQATLRLSDP
jgi:endonuclease/exonuclease/phosphatase family metal-dependent hydrolase